MNMQALHLDAAWSAKQEFGERLTIVANLGFMEVRFPNPMRHGDTLCSETTVIDRRLSDSRPGQGIVTLEHVGRNQDDVVVGRATRSTLVWTAEGYRRASR